MSQNNLTNTMGTADHQQSMEQGRCRLHRARGEKETMEVAWPCPSHQEGTTPPYSTDLGSPGGRGTEADHWGPGDGP